MSRGKFIALEGIDGCGKSTQVCLLTKYFDKIGLPYTLCKIRQVKELEQLLNRLKQENNPPKKSISLLFALDHALQNEMIISGALAEGKWVITDRSIYSAIAYNTALEMDEESLINLYKDFIKPDYVFFLDIHPEETYRQEDQDLLATGFGEDLLKYQNVVHILYQKYAKLFGFITINALKNKKDIHIEIKNTLKFHFKTRNL